MIRLFAAVAVSLFAAACSAPQVNFCGKTCLGANSTDCGPGYYCNATTGTCQTNDNTCGPVSGTGSSSGASGNASSSSSGSSGTPQLNSPCTPPTGTETDPCFADDAGLACNENSTFTATVCTLPVEYEPCVVSVGCESETPALVCEEITFSDGTSDYECINNCTTTADCPSQIDICQGTICYYDLCGPGSLPDGGPPSPDGLYAACDSEGVNDGTCFPYSFSNGVIGICEQDGSLQPNQIGCTATRTTPGGGTTTLCASGSLCVDAPDGTAYCAELCAYTTPPAGPSCSSATSCENLGELFGDCEIPCTTGTTSCPAQFTCQSGFCSP